MRNRERGRISCLPVSFCRCVFASPAASSSSLPLLSVSLHFVRPSVRSPFLPSFLPHSFFRPRAETPPPPPKPPHARVPSAERARTNSAHSSIRCVDEGCNGSHPWPCPVLSCRGEDRADEWSGPEVEGKVEGEGGGLTHLLCRTRCRQPNPMPTRPEPRSRGGKKEMRGCRSADDHSSQFCTLTCSMHLPYRDSLKGLVCGCENFAAALALVLCLALPWFLLSKRYNPLSSSLYI